MSRAYSNISRKVYMNSVYHKHQRDGKFRLVIIFPAQKARRSFVDDKNQARDIRDTYEALGYRAYYFFHRRRKKWCVVFSVPRMVEKHYYSNYVKAAILYDEEKKLGNKPYLSEYRGGRYVKIR